LKRAAILLSFALAAPAVQEKAPPRPRLSAESLALLGLAYASPPEIAADALLRIAAWDKAADRESKLFLIEQAFSLAANARDRYRQHAIAGTPADSRAGALDRAARLELDSLSLRARAVRAALAIDKAKARELFERIEAPRPEARSCQDALIFDLTGFYSLVADIAGQTFSAADLRLERHIAFVRPYLMSIGSPVDVAPATRLLRVLAATPSQRGLLAASLAAALAGVAADSRSSLETEAVAAAEIAGLAGELKNEGIAADGLREAFEKYAARQNSALACEAAGVVVVDLGAPGKTPRAADNPRYWTSPGTQALLERAMKLRWGPSGVPSKMLTLEERRSVEWQGQLADTLKEMASWKPGPEESEADHFNQRCLFYESLIDLTPPGGIRDNLSAAFLSFLSGAALQRVSPAEWLSHGLDVLTRLRLSGDSDSGRLAEVFARSGNPALMLTARLEQLAPRSPFLAPQ
jgi:hypothetical protein